MIERGVGKGRVEPLAKRSAWFVTILDCSSASSIGPFHMLSVGVERTPQLMHFQVPVEFEELDINVFKLVMTNN